MQKYLQHIKAESKVKEAENAAFRKHLLKIPFPEVDRMLHDIAKEVEARIDCRECANCCKVLEPDVSSDEIQRLKNLSSQPDFEMKQIMTEPDTSVLYMKAKPCVFLKNNLCTLYAHRPASCADYPHLQQIRSKFRMKHIIEQYGVCPIVYKSIEKLKEKTGFVMQDVSS
ncbi:MAG: YkgJ family cysteine cluster protein [Flavobacteriales bacterium]|nr:YkgJ family cysteine cluster protein [Flavobacteriales bacterium]